MRYRKLPRYIKQKVHEYYYQRYHGQLFNEQAILMELSQAIRQARKMYCSAIPMSHTPSLSQDVIKYNCSELVKVVPFFSNAEEPFITSMLTRLKFEVFLPDQHIIRCGSIGKRMYFIQHGNVDVIDSNGDLITHLTDGSYFGGKYSSNSIDISDIPPPSLYSRECTCIRSHLTGAIVPSDYRLQMYCEMWNLNWHEMCVQGRVLSLTCSTYLNLLHACMAKYLHAYNYMYIWYLKSHLQHVVFSYTCRDLPPNEVSTSGWCEGHHRV